MLQSNYRRSACITALALAVAACSGGGSDRSDDRDGGILSSIQGPLFQRDLVQLRELTGGDRPDFEDKHVAQTLDDMLGNADSLLMDRVGAKLATGAVPPFETVCSGPTCTSPTANALLQVELELSVSDLDYADADGSGNTHYEAVASHGAVSVAHGRGTTTFSGLSIKRYGYGGWMEHSFFVVESGEIMDGPAIVQGAVLTYPYSVGDASGTNPGTGGATWHGVMVGMDTMADGNPVQGDATITIGDSANPMLDVTFRNVHNLVDESTYEDMTWTGLGVTDGRFGGGTGTKTIEGQFYGTDHEEVGGAFTYDAILGAFGASR